MSVREEDRKKSNCSSRGVGLAAAAIGVGVGAALYYFYNKRAENPDGEGSTTGWNTEHAHNLHSSPEQEDSYITVSENETTDTSMHSSTSDIELSESFSDESSQGEWLPLADELEITEYTEDSSDSEIIEYYTEEDYDNEDFDEEDLVQYQTVPVIRGNSVDSEMGDWDITSSSVGVPESSVSLSPIYRNLQNIVSPIWTRSREISNPERQERFRSRVFRERTWSLEECSICFDVILKDQQVTTLPCTHHFHSACITPWLQEHQTCPNCRKAAE